MPDSRSSTVQGNRLTRESSPYLLQHAHNPVDWYPWGEEALQKARNEDKPILVSVGYSSCHWCHVMERESYEDEEVAEYMNEHFINIKVDREERPDIDRVYMEAVQALTGTGGWPLNAFCTPEAKPFFGGTYFPPQTYGGRPSWMQILKSVVRTFQEKREEVEEQGEKLLALVEQNSTQVFEKNVEVAGEEESFPPSLLDNIYKKLRNQFDTSNGGIGQAPKFPSTMILQFLLRYGYFTDHQEALDHVQLSLDKMMQGGIYDQLGGGFARYSTDEKWLVPHFEKMLYDNGLIVQLYAEACQYSPNKEYRELLEQTVSFIQKDFRDENGGFYSAYDADSEGEEGKFYVWTKDEIEQILNEEEAQLFCQFYGVTDEGNWEGANILSRQSSYMKFAQEVGRSETEVQQLLRKARQKLYKQREKRTKPGLDHKMILSWNCYMISGFAKTYEALQKKKYKAIARESMQFILERFTREEQENSQSFYHVMTEEKTKHKAFLDDYAALLKALLDLYQITFDFSYLQKAEKVCAYVGNHFYDESTGAFLYSDDTQEDILADQSDYFDNATPSGNALMAQNLQRLGLMVGRLEYVRDAQHLVGRLQPMIAKHPAAFGQWLITMTQFVYPMHEVAVVGQKYHQWANELIQLFHPNFVILASENEKDYPLLKGREDENNTWIYICQQNSCQQPVNDVENAKDQLIGTNE